MAFKRKRGPAWEYVIKNKKLLPKPITLNYRDEAEGDAYVAQLEALLRAGIVPQEFQERAGALITIGDAMTSYIQNVSVPDSDQRLLAALDKKIGEVRLSGVDYAWVASWVTAMKQEQLLSPSTIRHYVGALARCFDWLVNRKDMPVNPIRLLPKRYSRYSEADADAAKAQDATVRRDIERDRRLEHGEEPKIISILDGEKPKGKERPLALKYRGALELMFTLAVETAMRMRETFTLTMDQVDLAKRTVFLTKTKNGDNRQVPLSTVAIAAIKKYMEQVENGERDMDGFTFDDGRLFPWWDGDESRVTLNRITAKLSAQFARVFESAGCPDLHYHDLRHESTSRLYEKTTLSDLQISKITGHKSINMLRRYSNIRGSDLADRLW